MKPIGCVSFKCKNPFNSCKSCVSFKCKKSFFNPCKGCVSFKCKKSFFNPCKGCVSFKCKSFSNPCKGLLQVFKFKLRKPFFIRSLTFRRHQTREIKAPKGKRFAKLRSIFRSRKSEGEMDRVMELKSFSDAGNYQQACQAPFPSPITPAYVKMAAGVRKVEVSGQDDVEDACRSFENYLVEMIVEEGKTRDLTDVEELLYCWKHLKSPVFINLVCRFYGELCKDLFSHTAEEDPYRSMV